MVGEAVKALLQKDMTFSSLNPVAESLKMMERKKAFDFNISLSPKFTVPINYGTLLSLPIKNEEHNSFNGAGWSPPQAIWSGVGFSSLAEHAMEGATAKYVQFSNNEFGYCLELHTALRVNPIISFAKQGEQLSYGSGGPTAMLLKVPGLQTGVPHLKAISILNALPEKAVVEFEAKENGNRLKSALTLWKIKQAVKAMLKKTVKAVKDGEGKSPFLGMRGTRVVKNQQSRIEKSRITKVR